MKLVSKGIRTHRPVMAITDVPAPSISFESIKRVFSVSSLWGQHKWRWWWSALKRLSTGFLHHRPPTTPPWPQLHFMSSLIWTLYSEIHTKSAIKNTKLFSFEYKQEKKGKLKLLHFYLHPLYQKKSAGLFVLFNNMYYWHCLSF